MRQHVFLRVILAIFGRENPNLVKNDRKTFNDGSNERYWIVEYVSKLKNATNFVKNDSRAFNNGPNKNLWIVEYVSKL